MLLTILSRKPLFKKDGEFIKDLTQTSIRFTDSPSIEGIVSVNERMSMRPDLLSRAGYGTTDQWDMIMKYNGYSNPFSICQDDIFLIPSLDDMAEQLAPDTAQNVIAETVRKQYIDPSKRAQSDPRIAEAEKKRKEAQRAQATVGVPSVNNLPPNIAEEGDREIVIKGGKIYFGPDISKGKQECDVPLTKSEFIAKLIKNRLKNG